MDNLPKDPPDQNEQVLGSANNPVSAPLNIPNSPNIPNSVHSDVAKQRKRDAHGRFIPSERLTPPSLQQPSPSPQTPPTSQTTPASLAGGPTPFNLPPPITITENTKYSKEKDPPLFNISVMFTNPITYFKNWVSRFLKNQDIDLRLRIKPFATIGLVLAFSVVGGTAFSIGRYFFPNSSPILHRQVVYPGIIQKGAQEYYLKLSDQTLWKLKPKLNIDLSTLLGKPVIVTGNLTMEANLIEVSEIIIAEIPSQ